MSKHLKTATLWNRYQYQLYVTEETGHTCIKQLAQNELVDGETLIGGQAAWLQSLCSSPLHCTTS